MDYDFFHLLCSHFSSRSNISGHIKKNRGLGCHTETSMRIELTLYLQMTGFENALFSPTDSGVSIDSKSSIEKKVPLESPPGNNNSNNTNNDNTICDYYIDSNDTNYLSFSRLAPR